MKKAKRSLFILLLCVGLSAAALTGCSFKDSDSQNKELADCFLTEFLTINSDGRNDELMAKLQNNSELFTDEAVLHDALEEYYHGVSEYLTDECFNQLLAERTMWRLDADFLGAGNEWTISALDIQNTSEADSYGFHAELSAGEEVKELSGTLSFTADHLIASVLLDDYQDRFETSHPNWAEGLEEYGVGYYIKPVDYQAAAVDLFGEKVSEKMMELRKADLRELEEAEGKALVDEIREWCRQNAEKDFDSLCYQKGNDYWILYRNKAASGLSIWCEPELTEKMELKVRVCYTYPPVANQAKGVWCLEKISSPIPITKMIGYDDKTYDILFYNDFSKNSAGEDYLKDASNLYGINGGMVPRWDCRYILHDLITKGAVKGDTDTSVKPDVIGELKVSDEVKKEIREIYKSEWAGKDGLMVHKIDDVYWIYYCNGNSKKDADISIGLEGSKLVMNCYDNAKSLFDIEPFCWKLFAVKSPVTIEQVEIITGDDRQTVNV